MEQGQGIDTFIQHGEKTANAPSQCATEIDIQCTRKRGEHVYALVTYRLDDTLPLCQTLRQYPSYLTLGRYPLYLTLERYIPLLPHA